jgi:hypothetical protein
MGVACGTHVAGSGESRGNPLPTPSTPGTQSRGGAAPAPIVESAMLPRACAEWWSWTRWHPFRRAFNPRHGLGLALRTAGPMEPEREHQLATQGVKPSDNLQAPEAFLPSCVDRPLDRPQVKRPFVALDPTTPASVVESAHRMAQENTHLIHPTAGAGACKWGVHPMFPCLIEGSLSSPEPTFEPLAEPPNPPHSFAQSGAWAG